MSKYLINAISPTDRQLSLIDNTSDSDIIQINVDKLEVYYSKDSTAKVTVTKDAMYQNIIKGNDDIIGVSGNAYSGSFAKKILIDSTAPLPPTNTADTTAINHTYNAYNNYVDEFNAYADVKKDFWKEDVAKKTYHNIVKTEKRITATLSSPNISSGYKEASVLIGFDAFTFDEVSYSIQNMIIKLVNKSDNTIFAGKVIQFDKGVSDYPVKFDLKQYPRVVTGDYEFILELVSNDNKYVPVKSTTVSYDSTVATPTPNMSLAVASTVVEHDNTANASIKFSYTVTVADRGSLQAVLLNFKKGDGTPLDTPIRDIFISNKLSETDFIIKIPAEVKDGTFKAVFTAKGIPTDKVIESVELTFSRVAQVPPTDGNPTK